MDQHQVRGLLPMSFRVGIGHGVVTLLAVQAAGSRSTIRTSRYGKYRDDAVASRCSQVLRIPSRTFEPGETLTLLAGWTV
jgi:hypothetical protein